MGKSFVCPICGAAIPLRRESAGKKVRCRECGETVVGVEQVDDDETPPSSDMTPAPSGPAEDFEAAMGQAATESVAKGSEPSGFFADFRREYNKPIAPDDVPGCGCGGFLGSIVGWVLNLLGLQAPLRARIESRPERKKGRPNEDRR
jgi:DNA-directed RNA polymerase subunit RPC12/RpoP